MYMWKNRHLGDARRSAPFSSLSRIFSAHFLTARRTARYGDQMRADRVSSIVYTLKKPLLLTSREEYHDLLPSAFDPRSLSVLCLSLRIPDLFGSLIRKELPAVKRLLSCRECRSSAQIDRVLLFSIRNELCSTTKKKFKHIRITIRINIYKGYYTYVD